MSRVYFVGCGPGDPELITVKAKKLIQKADIVVYSGSLIPPPILKLCKKGKLHDAAGLVREEIFDLLYKNAKSDKLVIRLHDGDPSIYGAIKEQIDNLEQKGDSALVILMHKNRAKRYQVNFSFSVWTPKTTKLYHKIISLDKTNFK